jgi:uncharacterized protein YjbI with pentapeptide repeats
MANEDQLAILKKGVDVWNKWRKKHRALVIDFSGANLSKADLTRVSLSGANLTEANLSKSILILAELGEADLSRADLTEANLTRADLWEADLRGANLTEANLREAQLGAADLIEAHLSGADLLFANLIGANLSKAKLLGTSLVGTNLSQANLTDADLRGADLAGVDLNLANLELSNFSGALATGTVFGDIDLSLAVGLDSVNHTSPSTIGANTLVLSRGKIPEAFLRGCVFSDWEIEMAKLYDPGLSNQEINDIQYKVYDLRATRAFQISPLFISYSHADTRFVDKIGDCLTQKGIRYWRDKHEMKAGRIETQIDRAIQQNPTVLLVLSKNSLNSDWVEHEVRTARDLAKKLKRNVLCPVALDESWVKESSWPERIMEQIMEYYVVDFAEWQDDSKFDATFRRLIDGLELFYKK